MEVVYSVRRISLAVFASAAVVAAWAIIDHHEVFAVAVMLAHLGLAVFVGTEAFGPISRQRSAPARILARVCLVPYVLGGVAFLLSMIGDSTQ